LLKNRIYGAKYPYKYNKKRKRIVYHLVCELEQCEVRNFAKFAKDRSFCYLCSHVVQRRRVVIFFRRSIVLVCTDRKYIRVHV